jgi:hypothetical protein
MLTLWESALTLIFVTGAVLLFMMGLNRVWPVGRRYAKDDQIGWQLSILGTTYAVVLGFMLLTEWTNYATAELNTDLEASALRNIFRLAEGLPQEQRTRLEQQARAYADAVVHSDWPEMARGEVPEESHAINQTMWRTLMSVKTASVSEAIAEDHALTELSTLTEHRRTRLLQSVSRLPGVFWCVLLVGGFLTIVSVTMFGSVNVRLHAFHVVSLTILITLAMLAIADVDSPFRGWVHLGNYPFQRALQNMQELPPGDG